MSAQASLFMLSVLAVGGVTPLAAAAREVGPGKAEVLIGIETIELDVFAVCSTAAPAVVWAVTYFEDEPGVSDINGPRVMVVLQDGAADVTYYAGGEEPAFSLTGKGYDVSEGILRIEDPTGADGEPFSLRYACRN